MLVTLPATEAGHYINIWGVDNIPDNVAPPITISYCPPHTPLRWPIPLLGAPWGSRIPPYIAFVGSNRGFNPLFIGLKFYIFF